jgi:Gram-negative bacterial TonB protein C-terminal
MAFGPAYDDYRRASAVLRLRRVARLPVGAGANSSCYGETVLGSSVNLKSGLVAVGALRPEERNSQEPVALETTVIATGARPGDSLAKRELFTEETQTVLVFERGAVIRLSAAVADGQLLFLSNKSTGKEVVTQVLRKRSFRPTNCYVDLEFTEPCPGFWGIEFPKAGAASAGANAVAKLSADEDSENEPAKPAAPPSLQEVDRLKHEVAVLQTQLKSLIAGGPNRVPETAASAGGKPASGISAELARKKEEEKRLEELFAIEAKQEEAQSPKRLVAHPKQSANPSEKRTGSKKWMIAAGVGIVLVAGAGAVYRFAGFAGVATKAGASPAASQVAPGSAPATAPTSSAAHGIGSNASHQGQAAQSEAFLPGTQPTAQAGGPKNTAVVQDSPAAKESEFDSGDPSVLVRPGRPNSARGASGSPFNSSSVAEAARSGKRQPAAALHGTPAAAGSGEAPFSSANGSAAREGVAPGVVPDGDGYVAPTLVHAVKPVAPPEALKNYVTGNVKVDALVDATGHVKSVTVLSGPSKLRDTAVREMKQYVYEPARKNGKAVSAHVQLSLQYWYEP